MKNVICSFAFCHHDVAAVPARFLSFLNRHVFFALAFFGP